MGVHAMPLSVPDTTSSVTGYQQDTISRELVRSSVEATGCGIDPASAWPDNFWFTGSEESTQTLSPSRVIIRMASGVAAHRSRSLANFVDAVAKAWRPAASVPLPLLLVDLLTKSPDLSVSSSGGSLEIETTLGNDFNESDEARRPSASKSISKDSQVGADKASHARLARDLREMTGLSASALGGIFGISREQYSRWVSGNPISDVRHGQLIFLHTVVRELVRRLEVPRARAWLHQPIDGTATPLDMLQHRQFDKFYRQVSELPDNEPIVAGKIASLPPPAEMDNDDDDDDMPWSPYGGGGSSRQ
jgi:transcriptional regulator with XRE-family HTH domain